MNLLEQHIEWMIEHGAKEHVINAVRTFSGAGLDVKCAYRYECGIPTPNWKDENHEPIDGVYWGIPNDDYHQIKALSSTQLKVIVKNSAAHYFARYIDEEYEDLKDEVKKKEFTAGDLVHALILEGEFVNDRYYCLPRKKDYPGALITDSDLQKALKDLDQPMTKKGEKKEDRVSRLLSLDPDAIIFDKILADAEEENTGKNGIEYKIWRKAHKTYESCLAHKNVASMIRADRGLSELSIITTDPATGLRVRIRIDRLVYSAKQGAGWYQLDVKTTKSANPHKFSRDSAEYGYHIQQEFYKHVFRLHTQTSCQFGFLVAEWKDAYFPELMQIDNESASAAKAQMLNGMAYLKECMDTNTWPGYNKNYGLSNLSIPKYALEIKQ